MTSMCYCIATHCWPGWLKCIDTWETHAHQRHRGAVIANTDVLSAYQMCMEETEEPILAFIHDDVEMYEKGWDTRVLNCFDDPAVGVVGFGGALGHGTPNLYHVPYHLPNLARQNFLSNMRNAERHGARFTGERDVAVLDGFSLIVRRSILEKRNGWPVHLPVGYFMYAEWLCCEARRQGYRIRLVGIDCEHLGGKTSGHIPELPTYAEAHRFFYENNRDVMPYRVEG